MKRLLQLALIAIFGLSIVGFAPSAHAQSGISVFRGQISRGESYDVYRVQGRAGQMFVAWTEVDGSLDPQLTVVSPSGIQYWDDDSGDGLNARTGGLLVENGTYNLYVEPVGRTTGAYTLYYMALDLRSTGQISYAGEQDVYTARHPRDQRGARWDAYRCAFLRRLSDGHDRERLSGARHRRLLCVWAEPALRQAAL
ncbi:hypothetical protein [Oscillochloris sp. ZM17-4]|uniref:hypothetical protein n=1 Tax=Oscillochloris sp. ZM17-4 TaxID=2866714 RepID=UPI00351CDC61